LAAAGEQTKISAADVSSAARVCSVRVLPAVKSSRSRAKLAGNFAGRRLATDQVLVDRERFQAAMQPPRPAGVGVAVGNEGAIFEGSGL
jgi:hypothetical protein